jgi:hypothetical protein
MMATPDEVRASLLASGDHGRDGCARRKLAERVKTAILVGSAPVVVAAHEDRPEDAAAATIEMAKAASAVVLASGLRAPAETRTEFLRRLADDVQAGKMRMVDASDSPFRVPGTDQGSRPIDVSRRVVELGQEADRLAAAHAFPNRQGWRARLANVERLLAASLDSKTPRQAAETVADALAEVRAMIDGEGDWAIYGPVFRLGRG